MHNLMPIKVHGKLMTQDFVFILDVNDDSYHLSVTILDPLHFKTMNESVNSARTLHGSVRFECCSKTSWFVFQAFCAPV